MAPLPACFVQLTSPQKAGGGAAVSLRDEQIWSLVFPGHAAGTAPGTNERACTGRRPLEGDALAGGSLATGEDVGISLGGGGDRLKVVWLRSLTYADGTAGGALALVRGASGTAEVYAVGSYRGRPRSTFTIERLGPAVVVTATDDGCKGRKAGQPCASTVKVFAPRLGVLEPLTTLGQERISYASGSEPGVPGRVEYRLSSAIQYLDGGIRVLEQVTVRDEQARELRRAEVERSFTFAPGGALVVDEESLWGRVVPDGKRAAKAQETKTPPSPEEPDGAHHR